MKSCPKQNPLPLGIRVPREAQGIITALATACGHSVTCHEVCPACGFQRVEHLGGYVVCGKCRRVIARAA